VLQTAHTWVKPSIHSAVSCLLSVAVGIKWIFAVTTGKEELNDVCRSAVCFHDF
jgi:hypothetical protein